MSTPLPQKWLVTRFSALGDVTLTTGVLGWLHNKYQWRFDFVTKDTFAPVLANHPAIDTVYALNGAELKKKNLAAFIKQYPLNTPEYGLLDLHATLRTKLLARHWHGVHKYYPKFSLRRRAFLLTHNNSIGNPLLLHTVPQRYLMSVEADIPPAAELVPQIYLTEAEQNTARNTLASLAVTSTGKFVALHPYATYTNKTWPPDAWLQLCKLLTKQKIPWLIFGTCDTEREENAFMQAQFAQAVSDAKVNGVIAGNLTNTTTLREVCALLSYASVLVSGDSGPLHLASGVNTPVIALFGPTTAHWGFYPAALHDVVIEYALGCRPCSLHGNKPCNTQACLKNIHPETIMTHIVKKLNT